MSEKRRNYYAVVRRGEAHEVGKIFESWQEAEVEIKVSLALPPKGPS